MNLARNLRISTASKNKEIITAFQYLLFYYVLHRHTYLPLKVVLYGPVCLVRYILSYNKQSSCAVVALKALFCVLIPESHHLELLGHCRSSIEEYMYSCPFKNC